MRTLHLCLCIGQLLPSSGMNSKYGGRAHDTCWVSILRRAGLMQMCLIKQNSFSSLTWDLDRWKEFTDSRWLLKKKKSSSWRSLFHFTKVREKRCNKHATLKNVLRPSACPRLKKWAKTPKPWKLEQHSIFILLDKNSTSLWIQFSYLHILLIRVLT